MDEDAPATIDPSTKKMPEERFSSAGEVNSVCDAMIYADRPRAENRAKVQGLIDGNRPFRQASLIKNAQGWRGNVNFREGEGYIQSSRTPYYDLVTEISPCINLEVHYGRDDQAEDWAQKIMRRFHDTIFGWKSFDWHIQLQQSEMITHGYGSHLWLSQYDWRCKTKTMRNVLFPNETTSSLEDLEMFMVRDPQKAHELWASIKNEKAAAAVGWRPSAVKDALVRASKDDKGKRRTSEDVQAQLKRGDLGHSWARSKEVRLNHLFVREFCGGKNDMGGITHYIIEEGQDEYLYRRRHRFAEFSQVLCLFPYDIGSDGTLHSIRGLGTRIFPFCELSNRLKNHMVDATLVSTGVLLSQKGPSSVDPAKLQLTSVGPMKMLPIGVDVAQFTAMRLEQGPLALDRELHNTMSDNTKTYRQNSSDSSGREKTAFEVSVDQADSTKLQRSANSMYYRNLSQYYAETLRRLTNPNITTIMPGGKEAVEFQENLMRDGVPKEALRKIRNVQASRGIGSGSASQRLTATNTLMQVIYPTADDQSRNNIKRDFAAALVGYGHVDRYVPEINSANVPTDDDAMSVVENSILIAGGEAIVVNNQNHVRHAARHIQKAGELAQSIMQGNDPRAVLAAWDAIGPHIAGHLGFLERDPTRKAEFMAFHQQLTALSGYADKLRQEIAEADKAKAEQAAANPQPQQQQMGPFGDPELDMQWAAMQAETQMKFQKMQGDLAIKKAKTESDIRLKDAKTASDIARSNAVAVNQAVTKDKSGSTKAG